ncbi:MAG: DUF434 domain-containing protein [Myxococcales bacterium]|nr:DUF434 domain-containing protein [Myxococcales bacterium]
MELEGKGRGAHPRDDEFFAAKKLQILQEAVFDMSFLFTRSYAEASALKLVGDRYQLHQRQRLAILRSAASTEDLQLFAPKELELLKDQALDIDAFNLIILLESASGGGLILKGMDGCYRDLASVHGTYRMVELTSQLVRYLGKWLAQQEVAKVRWWIDQPVSNSGRLAALFREIGQEEGWDWEAETTPYVDREIAQAKGISVSTDKVIIRRCSKWSNVGRRFVDQMIPSAWIVDLGIRPPTL